MGKLWLDAQTPNAQLRTTSQSVPPLHPQLQSREPDATAREVKLSSSLRTLRPLQVQLNGGAAHLDLPHPHHPRGKLWHRGSAPRHGWRRVKEEERTVLPAARPWSVNPLLFLYFNQSRCASVTDDSAGRSAQRDCQRETGESCPARALWSRTLNYGEKTRKCFFIIRAHGEQRDASLGGCSLRNMGFEENASLKKKKSQTDVMEQPGFIWAWELF